MANHVMEFGKHRICKANPEKKTDRKRIILNQSVKLLYDQRVPFVIRFPVP
ncbi:MAG: hypothetical protein IJ851_02245 [Eubacterium sp.]|nr:hypothetical protein [Eubacterium sp.]